MKNLSDDADKRSRNPARLDVAQSLSGLALGVFMWTHLLLVSSILLGKDAMHFVTGVMEARFLSSDGLGYPIIVTVTGVVVSIIFMVHAAIALRKFPASWKQHKILRNQMTMMKHSDTNLWYTQFSTGFIMFFLGSIHLYVITTHPSEIGPYASADRFISDWMWPVYLVLLFAVELHATIGMYRLAVKWGIFDGADPRATRKRLKTLKNVLTVFFLALGITSFAAYVKIGLEHRDHAGERYSPASAEIVLSRGEHP